jgi:hypothetical protein
MKRWTDPCPPSGEQKNARLQAIGGICGLRQRAVCVGSEKATPHRIALVERRS